MVKDTDQSVRAHIRLPAAAIRTMEHLLPAQGRAFLQERNITVCELVARVAESNYAPQEILAAQLQSGRSIRIWIE